MYKKYCVLFFYLFTAKKYGKMMLGNIEYTKFEEQNKEIEYVIPKLTIKEIKRIK